MNLRDLQYLVAVADHLHFGKAALACNVSQPTLSMQLRKLEDMLDVQLIERSNKSVMLTPVGHEVVARARRTLDEASQIQQIARSSKDPLAGDVRLGIFPTLAPYLLPELMPALKSHFPKLNVLLVEEKTPELLTQLEAGSIDCAILAMPVENEHLCSLSMFIEPFLLAVPAGHRLSKRKYIALSDLHEETMLLLEEGHCLRAQALDICHMIGVGEAKNFRATSLETLRHMVAAGSAVTLIPKLAVNPQDKSLTYIPFKHPAPSRELGLYWRKTSARHKLFEKLAALVDAQYANLAKY